MVPVNGYQFHVPAYRDLWAAVFHYVHLFAWIKKNKNNWKSWRLLRSRKASPTTKKFLCLFNYPPSPIGGISTQPASATRLLAWEEISVCLCTANTGSVVQLQFLILMISWIHSASYLREGRGDPLENSHNCFYLIFIKPHSRIIWWLSLLYCSSLWHFWICFAKRNSLLSQRLNSRIFAEKTGSFFWGSFEFKGFCNIDSYLILSPLSFSSSPSIFPAARPFCVVLHVHRASFTLASPGCFRGVGAPEPILSSPHTSHPVCGEAGPHCHTQTAVDEDKAAAVVWECAVRTGLISSCKCFCSSCSDYSHFTDGITDAEKQAK